MEKDPEAYSKMVDYYLKIDSSNDFGNFTTSNAKVIITKFLETTKESVEILSGNFYDAFYDGNDIYAFLKSAAKRINKKDTIRIVTLNSTLEQTQALRNRINLINEEIGANVINYISAQYTGDSPVEHFMLVDNKRYRIETPHEVIEEVPTSTEARACCNDPSRVSEKLSLFNDLWKNLVAQLQKAQLQEA